MYANTLIAKENGMIQSIEIIIVPIMISCTACIGDGVLRLKGSIVDQNNSPINDCVLEVHLVENGRIFHSRKVNTIFDIDLTVNPRRTEYYFIIRCDEIYQSYQTAIYKINGTEYASTPLDLGRIVLRGMKEKQ